MRGTDGRSARQTESPAKQSWRKWRHPPTNRNSCMQYQEQPMVPQCAAPHLRCRSGPSAWRHRGRMPRRRWRRLPTTPCCRAAGGPAEPAGPVPPGRRAGAHPPAWHVAWQRRWRSTDGGSRSACSLPAPRRCCRCTIQQAARAHTPGATPQTKQRLAGVAPPTPRPPTSLRFFDFPLSRFVTALGSSLEAGRMKVYWRRAGSGGREGARKTRASS